MNIYLLFLIFVIGLIFIKPCNANMQSPRGFFEIKQAALHLEIAVLQMNCSVKNRKFCSHQIAKIEVK